VANHASAEKRNRQRVVRTERNRSKKSEVRTMVKKVRAAVSAKDKGAAETALRTATRVLDRAASQGALHTRSASRTISRLAAAVAKLAK
jgi:small subunit ribosomal protein S20